MMHADYINWTAAVVVSLLVHGAIFMRDGARMGTETAQQLHAPRVTRLSFSQPLETLLADAPIVPAKPQSKPVAKPVSKPVSKPLIKSAPAPVQKRKKIRPPAPVEIQKPILQPASRPQASGQQVVQMDDGLLQRNRQQYLHALLQHIDAHKFYPRTARKRALAGEVNVYFVLRDDGGIDQLRVSGRHKLLAQAARKAVESSIPLPVPAVDIGISRQIEFNMSYSLAN